MSPKKKLTRVGKPKIIRTEQNEFVKMIQLYLDHKGFKAKVTINKDGFLDILYDFHDEVNEGLSQVLSQCLPISYIQTNTAKKRWIKIAKRNMVIHRMKHIIKSGIQISHFDINIVGIYQFRYENDYLITNTLEFKIGQTGCYSKFSRKGKSIVVFIISNKELFPTTLDFKVFWCKLIAQLK